MPKQIAPGLVGYPGVPEGSLPSLYNGTSMSYPLTQWDLFHTHSWQASLLPHLEQAGLRQQIAWDALPTDPVNDAILQTVVPAYVCPAGSDPSSSMGEGRRHGAVTVPYEDLQDGDVFRAARSDYDRDYLCNQGGLQPVLWDLLHLIESGELPGVSGLPRPIDGPE